MLTLKLKNRLRTGRWVFLAMLLPLHGVMLLGTSALLSYPLLLAHFGLFLIWQPLWSGEREVGRDTLAFIVLAAAAMLFWLNWWLIAFWLTGLFGLVGARVFVFRDRWTRLSYLAVMGYLLAALLLWVVPQLFGAEAMIAVGRVLMWYVLPWVFPLILLLPVSEERIESAQTVDFIYSLLLFTLLMLVVLGSLAFMTLTQVDYLEALLRALFLIALVLLALAMLWSPRFGGMQVMFSRYLLNIGTPFESWLSQLADAAQRAPDAAAYLERAVRLLEDFPWLSGLSWQSPDGAGQSGHFSEHDVQVREGDLRLTLYARQTLNPTMLLHIHLLSQMIGYFYQSKRREQRLRDITRQQAVYETGARLTHDLKNMLQSLLALTSAAQSREARAQQLVQEQLPLLGQRIELIMGKLQQPLEQNEMTQLTLPAWWDGLRHRHPEEAITWWAPEGLPQQEIPAPLFDCVADNLIDNALRKQQAQPKLHVTIELCPEPLCLTVCDDGDAIPSALATRLLQGVVVSQNGLGVGLYQAARWAEQSGYRLTLASNRPGEVCFMLEKAV